MVDVVPVVTFPKFIAVELKDSVSVGATPVPLNATVAGEFGTLLTMLIVPDDAPGEVGAKLALNVAVAAGATATGMVRPLTEYPAALMLS